ncbi:MAG TPA: 4'-phosphopantetheinyl transferase superfamily protein [Sphingomonas sp.]|nr:4'-phosphopantetheinyl transferase superfamily protein [Sphingomonas sp.]
MSDVEVGCDIERHRPLDDWRAIADRLFAPGERARLAALDEIEGRITFFRSWARKEAFVKALGQGLSYPLDAFEVTVGPEARLLGGGEGWMIAAVEAGTDVAAAVVAQGDQATISILP